MEIRKELKGEKRGIEEEGLMIKEIKWEREKVETVYVREKMRKVLERIKVEAEEKKGEKGWIVKGDFNARTGEREAMEEGEEGRERMSKDKLMNKQGEELVKWVEEGWDIMNGMKEGDEEGEITFTEGRRERIIDYVIGGRGKRENGGRKRDGVGSLIGVGLEKREGERKKEEGKRVHRKRDVNEGSKGGI